MIAFGSEGQFAARRQRQPRARLRAQLNRFIIDQHFRQRDRLGRLTAALAYNPFAVGIGLDEDTAAFIGPDNTLEVEGSGAITVVDASRVQFTSMDQPTGSEPVCIIGLQVHIRTAGATFNLHTREGVPGDAAAQGLSATPPPP